MTIFWSPRSAQHVSGNFLPISRSVRLRFTATWHIVPRCNSPDPNLLQRQDTIPRAVISVLRSWRWAKSCLKHVELILEINKLLLLHLVGFFYIILPTLMMHGQTQIKQNITFRMHTRHMIFFPLSPDNTHNIQKFYILPTECFCVYQNKQWLLTYTTLTDWFYNIEYVYCVEQTESLNIIKINFKW
jgi:hypothetical protein